MDWCENKRCKLDSTQYYPMGRTQLTCIHTECVGLLLAWHIGYIEKYRWFYILNLFLCETNNQLSYLPDGVFSR